MDPTMTGERVRDLMVPLAGYTTIGLDATLAEAFTALNAALRGAGRADPESPRDFAVLVLDADAQVVGRLVVWDVLQGLEPQQQRGIDALAMVDGLAAWHHPLANLAAKARDVKVRDLVRQLDRGELIDAEAPLDEAIHRLNQLRALSLIVTDQRRTVGVLRVVDVFQQVNALVQGSQAP
jgi:hypothetical protein